MDSIILIFGAGKSSFYLIDHLKKVSIELNMTLVVADINIEHAKEKLHNFPKGKAISLAIENKVERQEWISKAKLVISLLPPKLHYLVALDCIEFKKSLFTASYRDEKIKLLNQQIIDNKLLFLYEMGLDPGIDHISAKKIIDSIHLRGGSIISFISHCGGLIAPESDNNPWHYKLSWNPKNVVQAGKQGAIYKENGKIKELNYFEIFNQNHVVNISETEQLAYYSNRNSLPYIDLYNLHEIETFQRTTLRHPDFCLGWNLFIRLGLTEDKKFNAVDSSFKDWVYHVAQKNDALDLLNEINFNSKYKILFDFFNLNSDDKIPAHLNSNENILQYLMEEKLKLQENDHDRIVMLHEIIYKIDDLKYKLTSTLIVDGINNIQTAMAKTVGLPLALAVELFLKNKIDLIGLQIPIHSTLYNPILSNLKELGIVFKEQEYLISN